MIALIEAYKVGLLKKQHWLSNIIAGFIVGVIALPLAMAFAVASGTKPEQGLYTAVIAGLVVGIFGGSRVQIAGPTGAFIIVLANITSQYGIDGLQIATLMGGIILLFMGLTRLGDIIKFIPDPVIVGFTSGIAVIIFVNQCKDFLGISNNLIVGRHFHEKIWCLIKALPDLSLVTTSLAILSLLITLLSPKIMKRIPGPLVALVIGTLLQILFQFDGVATIGSVFGSIPNYFPSLQLPKISLDLCLDLIGPAFAIALLGAIESLLSAVVADGMINTRHNSNQELIGQGLANIVSPLFGGFAATGAIARTTINVHHGGNSPLSSIIHSITLLLIIWFFAPLAVYVPLCTLAAILFVVAYNMSEAHHFTYMVKHAPKNDVLVLVTTFILTIFVDLVVAVNIGVMLAVFLFMHRMSQSVSIEEQSSIELEQELAIQDIKKLPEGVLVYSINGPFFFGAAEALERTLKAIHVDPNTIIFRLKHVPFMDITGLQVFHELTEQFRRRGVKVFVCEANAKVAHKLININLLKLLQSKKIYTTLNDVLYILSKKRAKK